MTRRVLSKAWWNDKLKAEKLWGTYLLKQIEWKDSMTGFMLAQFKHRERVIDHMQRCQKMHEMLRESAGPHSAGRCGVRKMRRRGVWWRGMWYC